jgi:hypothetical protein
MLEMVVVAAAAIHQYGVMNTAEMLRSLLRVIVRGLPFPNDLVDEIVFAENLVEHHLNVVTRMPIAMIIESACRLKNAC